MPHKVHANTIIFFIAAYLCPSSCFSSSPPPKQYTVLPEQNFITYEFSGGRFGDNLMAYLHAKWISYLYEIPLLYKSFAYSSELALHDIEIPYNQVNWQSYNQENFFDAKLTNFRLNNSLKLYVVPYFPESKWERKYCANGAGNPWSYFSINWTDPNFRKVLNKCIIPKETLSLVVPPSDCINIAIHYREGGGYDQGDFTMGFLTKFPSIDFYIQGILKVIRLFQGQPLYCYFFTDALNSYEFIEKIRSEIPSDTKIIFDFRARHNFHDKNVLEDFFSLFNFDVLIHSESNFSIIPSLIHDYSVTYTISSAHLEDGRSFVDEVYFKVNKKKYEQRIKSIKHVSTILVE